jgi:hypothetical protein
MNEYFAPADTLADTLKNPVILLPQVRKRTETEQT